MNIYKESKWYNDDLRNTVYLLLAFLAGIVTGVLLFVLRKVGV